VKLPKGKEESTAFEKRERLQEGLAGESKLLTILSAVGSNLIGYNCDDIPVKLEVKRFDSGEYGGRKNMKLIFEKWREKN
jgi:hypothetical protein